MIQELASREDLLTLLDFVMDEVSNVRYGQPVDESILALAEHVLEQG